MTPQAISGLPTWLHMLAQVYPPHCVALVGAGNGTGPLVQWLQSQASQAGQAAPALPAVTLLEPHAPSMAQLAKRLAGTQACAEWRLLPELLAPEQGEHTYHQYTLAAENGLLPPEALHPLWSSLQLQSQQPAATVPLAHLLPAGWLLLDCLPAAHLLQGTRLPASTQVVLARVVLSDAAPAGSSLANVQALLAQSGFKAVATFAERNSALGKALFVRDPKGLQDNIDQALAKAQALEADKAQLTDAKDKALAQVQQLAQEKAQAQQRCDELVKVKEAETVAKQAVSDAKAALQIHLEQARQDMQAETAAKLAEAQARNAEKQAKEQALGQLQALQSENAQLLEAKEQALAKVLEVDKVQKFSSDADIDDFIEDIAPFFCNRAINYVDVGAYTGEVFTKFLASQKIKLREAHLIEPNPESYQKLQEAVKLIKLSSCNTYNVAISSNPGTATFKAAKSMTKRIRIDISSESASNLFEIECRMLDDFSELFTDGRAHLMKLDVEGEELDVLKSAELLLKEQRVDVLYVEVGLNRAGTQQTYFGDLDAMLQNYGYRVFKIYEQKNEWINDSPLLRRCNAAYMSSRFESANPYSKTIEQ